MTRFIPHLFIALVIAVMLGSGCSRVYSQGSADPAGSKSPSVEGTFDESEYYTMASLTSDLRLAHIVAFIDVQSSKAVDSIGGADCEKNTGGGECLYILTADVKESFKGNTSTRTLEFYESADAEYPRRNFLGPRVVFLVKNRRDPVNGLPGSIENSSREIKFNVLEKLRRAMDPNSVVDDNDETDPYSTKALEKLYDDADEVVYANVNGLKTDTVMDWHTDAIMSAAIGEVLKGGLKPGQNIEYNDDLAERQVGPEDLGYQVLFLKREVQNGKITYEKVEYSEIKHEVLEKLRKIAASRRHRRRK